MGKRLLLKVAITAVLSGALQAQELYIERGFETVTMLPIGPELGELSPRALVLHPTRGAIVSDEAGHRLLELPWGASSWRVLSGGEGYADRDGVAEKARFSLPQGMAIDGWNNLLIADAGNHKIRRMIPEGNVSTLAGEGERGDKNGPVKSARFSEPGAVLVLPNGDLLVADTFNHKIRRVSGDTVTDYAGGDMAFLDGTLTQARFAGPSALCRDDLGNVYVADTFNHAIRKITPQGRVSTLAGKGVPGYKDGKDGLLNYPIGIAWHPAGFLLVADARNHALRVVAKDGSLRTAAGGSEQTVIDLKEPTAVAVDREGRIFVLDGQNRRIVLLRYGLK